MNYATLEPMLIVKLVGSMFCVSGIADVKVRSGNDFFVGVDYCHVDDLSGETRTRVESLNLEAEIIMAFMDL